MQYKKTESRQYPKIKRKAGRITVPVSIKEVSKVDDDGTTNIFYEYFLIEVPNRGEKEIELKKELTLKLINKMYDKEVTALLAKYPQREVDTFYKQLEEAKAYIADNTASVPFIKALAAERNLSVSEMANRIVTKDADFTLASGQLTGKRQRLESEVASATTVAEVEAIVW